MKYIFIFLCFSVGMFSSCQSEQEKQRAIDEENKKQQAQLQIQQKEEKLIQKQRKKEEILRNAQEKKEQKLQEELLSDSLLEETAELNKQAMLLLSETNESTSVGGEFDLVSDNSLTKFVNNTHAFTNKEYVPQGLVALRGPYIIDMKGNSFLRKEALKALDDLSQNFYLQFKESLPVVSAYRSYSYQQGIKDRGCSDLFCAKAGYSEHQSGLAIDFWEVSTSERFEKDIKLKSYVEWMKEHAHVYGFTNTYQKGLEVDGYSIEPWHWRYVGTSLAKVLKDYDITFAEYYLSPENY